MFGNLKHVLASKGAFVAIVATASIGGVALVSVPVLASLNATAFNTTAHGISVGTLKLTQGASSSGLTAGFTTPITLVAPGDSYNRFIDITNGGTLAGSALTLKVAEATASTLATDATNGLQVAVSECTAGWTSGGLCTAGAVVNLVNSNSTNSANALLSPLTFGTATSLSANAVLHLKFAISLPAGSETTINGALPSPTVQGVSTNLTWTFTEAQRAVNSTPNA